MDGRLSWGDGSLDVHASADMQASPMVATARVTPQNFGELKVLEARMMGRWNDEGFFPFEVGVNGTYDASGIAYRLYEDMRASPYVIELRKCNAAGYQPSRSHGAVIANSLPLSAVALAAVSLSPGLVCAIGRQGVDAQGARGRGGHTRGVGQPDPAADRRDLWCAGPDAPPGQSANIEARGATCLPDAFAALCSPPNSVAASMLRCSRTHEYLEVTTKIYRRRLPGQTRS